MSNNYINDSQASEIVKYISDTMKIPVLGAGGGFAPIGTVNAYMGTTAPQGWLVCDGTVYNILNYPDLATHIASQFGSVNFFGGDGTITFAVPDTTDITSTTLENGVFCIKATVSGDANAHHYSTEEQIVGTWIDGKTLYERTVTLTTKDPFDFTDWNTDMVDMSSINIFQSTYNAPPYYASSRDWYNVYINNDDNGRKKLYLRGEGGCITDFVKLIITFRYTKTTDQWQTS